MLSAQLAMPLYGAAQEPDNDASFRKNLIGGGLLSNPIQIPPAALRLFDPLDRSNATKTPIKHVILIIGENRTFDHVFATYTPPAGQTVSNLLSKGIVTTDWCAGHELLDSRPNGRLPTLVPFRLALLRPQLFPSCPQSTPMELLKRRIFPALRRPRPSSRRCRPRTMSELANGGTGLAGDVVDTRFPFTASGSNVDSFLPNFNGPLDMDPPLSYDDYASSPVHRFFQMWQQLDCDATKATKNNNSGCQNDLFPWVETTIGAGSNGAAQPSPFTNQTTGEGSTAMQFFNVANGTDVPYFTQLAQQYALSDNFHQSVMGGTGANHIMLGYGSLIYYADTHGNPAIPPAGQIENPNPQPTTNNYYTNDGYGSTVTRKGGSYVNCSDNTQAGRRADTGLS